jgi:hypothetical protein
MCEVCEAAKKSTDYAGLLDKMLADDAARLEFSKQMAQELAPLKRSICSSLKWPVRLVYPMFEARAAFSVPQNYFQGLMLDGERLGASFAHGAMRSLFFAGGDLIVFSKTVNHHDGREFFTSFMLALFKPGEYSAEVSGEDITIRVDAEKGMRNLISGEMENRRISFNFINNAVKNRIVTREQVLNSAQFKNVYAKFGGASAKSASIDIEGYAITVPHFSPHPYLLQLKEQFGYESNRQFQENVVKDYFLKHMKKG